MSRLFSISRPLEEIVAHFGVDVVPPLEVPPETIEGTYGLVVIEKDGLRRLKLIPWGFPRQTSEMRRGGEPPGRIGLVADLTNPMWEQTVIDPRYRCLIPMTHFANPDGPKGSKMRTWFSLHRQPLMALAGFCRNTREFGPVFAGMTGEANDLVRPLNDRMPVILKPDEYERWLDGGIDEVIKSQFREPIPSDDFSVLETMDRWQSGIPPSRSIPRKSTRSML